MSYLVVRHGWRAGTPDASGTGQPALLRAKLVAPPAVARFVDRPRLWRVLTQWPTRRVTMVSAPAGYGKSTLAASWAARADVPDTVGWVSLDRADRDPHRFWAYALAALRETGALPPEARHVYGVRSHRDLLCILESLHRPVALVLDDFDAVVGSAAARSLARCLRYPSPLHLVITSRVQPPLPTGRLLLDDELTVLDRADLAFTTAEIVELAAVHGVALNREQAADLGRRSDGWVTGLTLALRGQHHRDPARVAANLVGDSGPIADYLRDEVLAGQPRHDREWLLRTSILHRIAPQSADAVTGHADALPTLRRLRAGNTFVLDEADGSGTARIHPLMRDLLHREAATELRDELPGLHRGAADCLAGQGDPVAAVEHAMAVPDWGYAATLAIRYALPHLYAVDADRLRAALHAMACAGPEPSTPEVTVAAAFGGGAPGPLPGRSTGALLAAVALREVLTAQERGDPGAVLRACDRLAASTVDADGQPAATQDAPDPDRPVGWDATGYAALARYHHGVAQLWSGRLVEAERELAEAGVAARAAGLELAEARARGHGALLLALCGRLHEAEHAGIAASRYARGAGVPAGAGTVLALWLVRWLHGGPDTEDGYLAGLRAADPADPAPLAVALVHASAGDGGATDGVPAARERLAGRPVPPLLRPWLAAYEADNRLRAGDPAAALDAVAGYLTRNGHRPGVAAAPALLAAARAHAATGAYRPARTVLGTLLSGDCDGLTRVSAWLLDAAAAEALGHSGAVRIALAEALATAAAQRLVRPLRTGGPTVAALLRRHHDLVDALPVLAGRLDDEADPVALAAGTIPARVGRVRAGRAGTHSVNGISGAGVTAAGLGVAGLDGARLDNAALTGAGLGGAALGGAALGGAALGGARVSGTRLSGSAPSGEATSGPGRTHAGPGFAEAVTERESVVLRYLPTMLTTDDIAAELSVSRNTVKSQIRSIYRKLGVARRRDAVHRARVLHLL